VFKIIISDNGRELSELLQMEKDISTKIGLVHHYSSWERKRMGNYSYEDIIFIVDWCNALPRKILGCKTPDELFDLELAKIYASSWLRSMHPNFQKVYNCLL